MLKHGVYAVPILRGEEIIHEFYWMGEQVKLEDFNERLRNQARSIMKDLDSIQMGMDLHEAITDGKELSKVLDMKEKCARIAEDWRPPPVPEFSNLRLQAEAEQLDAKLREVKLEVARSIAQAIREL